METRIQQRYRPTEEIELKQFTWRRWQTGFCIVEKPSPRFPANDQFLELVDGGPFVACETYDPFSEPELEIQFSELKEPDDALGFANRFGMLGLAEESWRQADPELVSRVEESITEWLMEAKTVRNVLTIWTAVQAKDVYGLRKVIRKQNDGSVIAKFEDGSWDLIAAPWFNQKWLQKLGARDVLGFAKLYLAGNVNRHLRRSTDVGVTLNSALDFKPRHTPINLLSAIWIRVSEILTGVRDIRTCEICNGFIDVSNNRSHKRVHTKCSVKMRVRKWRASQ